MDQILPYIFNAFGGAGAAPLICIAMGGRGLGPTGNMIAGIVGGLGAGALVQSAGLQNLLGPDGTIVGYAQDLMEGVLGGAALGAAARVVRGKTHA